MTLSALQPQEEIRLIATLTDADGFANGNVTRWRWSRSSSKTGTFTNIAGATTANHTPTEDDVDMYLRATATYDDGEGEGKTAQMVSANPVRAKPYENADPVFENEYGEEIETGVKLDRSVAEDTDAGGNVGEPVTATDDTRDVLTYLLTDSTNTFTIDSGTGQIKVAAGKTLNFEEGPSYSVMVTATDPPGRPDTITVNISVIDVDEAPTIMDGDTAVDFAEDAGTSTILSTYMARDPEDGNTTPVRWSLSGADSSKFSIDTVGQLTFNEAPDFEAEADANSNNIYEVTVTATDSTGNTASRDVTVNVTNVDETGTLTLSTLQPEAGTPMRAELSDPDGSISGLTWRWSNHAGPISTATSSAYTPDDEDAAGSGSLSVTATYNDGAPGLPRTLTATSDNPVLEKDTSNKAPKFPDQDPDRTGDQSSSTPRSVAENTAAGEDIGDEVTAKDCDAPTPAEQDQCADPPTDTLTYTLEGRDKDSFEIDPEDGQLMTKASLDYETKRSYTVTVKATDPTNASDTISVTIAVTNEDEMPELSGVANVTYAENGTGAVATYTARDPERATVIWTLDGNDAGDFSISGGTLRFNSPPDFEAPKGGGDPGSTITYAVTVRASDGGADTTATRTVTVTVLNLDEPGTVTLSAVQPKQGVEITATLDDPDGTVTDRSWQWAQSSSKTGTFTNIRDAGSTCAQQALECYKPDEDDVGKYLRATVTYKDGQSTRVTKTAFVVSTNAVLKKDYVNTAPVFPDQDPDMEDVQNEATTRSIPETAAPRSAVGAPVAATDMGETRLEVLTYTLTNTNTNSGHADLFDIDRMTGQIRVKQGTILNFHRDKQIQNGNHGENYEVTVTATDPGNKSETIEVTINVTNVDEAPTIAAPALDASPPTGHTAKDHAEKTLRDTAVSTYSATDPEDDPVNRNLKWSLSGNDADLFCIGNGSIRDGDFTAGALRFKASPDFEAPADAGHNNTYNVTVVVTDSRGNTATRDVVVTVTNVEEAGEVTLSSVQPEDGEGLSAVLNDLDGRTTSVKWQWYRSKGGTAASPLPSAPSISSPSQLYFEEPDDGDWEKIVGKTSATYVPVSDDVGNFLLVTATYTDRNRNDATDDSTTNQDETKDQARVASANAVQGPDTNNKPPKFPDQDPNTAGDQKDQTREVAENSSSDPESDPNPHNVGAKVVAVDCDGAATCTDSTDDTDNTDNLTYELSGTDAPSFRIDRETGQITVAPGAKLDYETKQTYTVTVKATDPSDESDSITVTINVTNVEEAPTLSKRALVISGRSNVDHPENDRSTVATYTAAGPQATRVSWSLLGDDAGDFSISGGRLDLQGDAELREPGGPEHGQLVPRNGKGYRRRLHRHASSDRESQQRGRDRRRDAVVVAGRGRSRADGHVDRPRRQVRRHSSHHRNCDRLDR